MICQLASVNRVNPFPSRSYDAPSVNDPQVPPLAPDWLVFVLSRALSTLARLAFCRSRLEVFRDWTAALAAAPIWLIRLRSKLVEVREECTVLSPAAALAERDWLALPLSKLLTVFNWLLLACSAAAAPPDWPPRP